MAFRIICTLHDIGSGNFPIDGQQRVNYEILRQAPLGLHWRDDRLLAAEVYDRQGRVVGIRPLGGTVEFGESSQTALKREFLEEIGAKVMILSAPLLIENIYEFEGENGHEIIFVFDIGFVADDYQLHETIAFDESDGTSGVAPWYAVDKLDRPGSPNLYPKGLKELLLARNV
ncbi:NUDIX hydrolase [Agrobacterium cavarae]|uniref:NUDIX hydrolase n=1 Tax=Agrobacterium cavarae TaxID=2528239 RepID=UPI003EE69E35